MITRTAEQIEHEKQQAHALDAVAFERWLSGEVQSWQPIQEARAIVADRARDRMQWIQASVAKRDAKATAELHARIAAQRHAREISPAFIERKQRELAALMAARKLRENLIMARLDGRPTFEGVPCVRCGGTRRYTARTYDCVACAGERHKQWVAANREHVNAAARAKRDRRPLPFVRTPEQRAVRSAKQKARRAARRAA